MKHVGGADFHINIYCLQYVAQLANIPMEVCAWYVSTDFIRMKSDNVYANAVNPTPFQEQMVKHAYVSTE